MGFHPANLVIRFVLELSALVAMGVWAWRQSDGIARYAYAILVPLLAAAVWGIFAVSGDASRSGKTVVAVSGLVRLGIEAAFFGFAAFALYRLGNKPLFVIFVVATSVHYVISYDRIGWLLRTS
jgi:hypothetical protein